MDVKTDWENGERFTITHYNRIKNNIQSLKNLSLQAFPPYDIINIANANYDTLPYVSFFNNIENNLETMANKTFRYEGFPATKTLVENGPAWDAADLNRIESICKEWEWLYNSTIVNLPVLSLVLGGDKI